MARRAHPVGGRTILITGAARGIGAETARRMAARGARVALCGLEPELLEAVAADCPGAIWRECDVTDRAAVQAVVDGTVEALGGIDVVIANAGIGRFGTIRDSDEAAWERVIEVNLLGVWRTVRAALPHVIARRGYVLPVSSLAAVAHLPGMASYATSKAAVEAFGNTLRGEVRHLGVDVGVAYFGWIDTEMVRGIDRDELMARLRAQSRPPLDRTYPVAEAAEAIVSGVEQRARVVCHPRGIRALMAARGLLQPLAERQLRSTFPALDRAFAARVAEAGAVAASAPSGAGGEADARVAAR